MTVGNHHPLSLVTNLGFRHPTKKEIKTKCYRQNCRRHTVMTVGNHHPLSLVTNLGFRHPTKKEIKTKFYRQNCRRQIMIHRMHIHMHTGSVLGLMGS